MDLVRLIYTSRVVSSFDHNDIKAILTCSQKNNSASGLTGLLMFNSDYFIQCLEGARAEVNKTFQRISQDNRHKDILLLAYSEVHTREFVNWDMGYISLTDVERNRLFKYSSTSEINPYLMSGETASQFIISVKTKIT